MIITDYLENNALMHSEKISLIDASEGDSSSKRELTWSEFNIDANKLSNWLINNGIVKSKKVCILTKNCIDILPIYFGILKAGDIVVPLNYTSEASELQYCLNLVGCSVLIYSSEYLDIIEKMEVSDCYYICIGDGNGYPGKYFTTSYNIIKEECPGCNPQNIVCKSDDAAIFFSSGTTGNPKAVLLSHESLVSSAITEQIHHAQTINDNFLIIAPLCHTGALIHWFGSLLFAGTATLMKYSSPINIIKIIEKKKITIAWMLLPYVQDILDAVETKDILIDKYDLSNWRLTHMGAQPIPPSVVLKWISVFPQQQFDINYGLTESGGPGCIHLGVDNRDKANSIGKSGFGWQTIILDKNKNEQPKGTVGELAVKGKGLMTGYYKDAMSTDEVLVNGWLLTGDMAYKDNEDFIYLVGRKKDIIISGGENIYPIQIETYFKSHPLIKDVAVIGLPNDRLGEIVCAIIELKDGSTCTRKELTCFCNKLPLIKRPFRYIFGKVPRNAMGKIEKNKLKEQYH